MDKNLLKSLVSEASGLALSNCWGENAFDINMKILEIDENNSAACTRLAKYYRLNDNLSDAKKMYSRALEINPNSIGARNNLIEIEEYQKDKAYFDTLSTEDELYNA
ncbi:MAG TPA: hypothetical protein VF941_10210, partial [Clostridia bacterium]